MIPKTYKFKDDIDVKDIEKIKKFEIDIFIRLGFRILTGEILNTSKFGIWSYHHGDNKTNRGMPAGVWEVLEQEDVTGITLQILGNELDGGTIIHKSYLSTSKYSIIKNRYNIYKKSIVYLPRKVKQLYDIGESNFLNDLKKTNNIPNFYDHVLYKKPSNVEIVKGFSKYFLKWIYKKIVDLLYRKQWIILYRFNSDNAISSSFFNYTKITPPKDRIWADPFIWKNNNQYYIFMEEMLYSENKGKISVMQLGENRNFTKPQVIIEEDYHLSYPFMIEDKGELFMIPESGINETINLYKCIEFPGKWEFVKFLMTNISAVDTTIFKFQNKYWLFANLRDQEDTSIHEELFLFFSDDLVNGKWNSHPKNPIVTDVRCSRPAGKIFSINNRIFRPAQNCAKYYGHGMKIQEILILNEKEYVERTVDEIYPNWSNEIIATHTFNHLDRLSVIDAIEIKSKINS